MYLEKEYSSKSKGEMNMIRPEEFSKRVGYINEKKLTEHVTGKASHPDQIENIGIVAKASLEIIAENPDLIIMPD